MNGLKIEYKDEIKRAKEIFVTDCAKRDSALSSLEQEKKENEELQGSIFKLSSRVTEQNKLLAVRDEEIHKLKEAYLSEKKGFQSLTTSFYILSRQNVNDLFHFSTLILILLLFTNSLLMI